MEQAEYDALIDEEMAKPKCHQDPRLIKMLIRSFAYDVVKKNTHFIYNVESEPKTTGFYACRVVSKKNRGLMEDEFLMWANGDWYLPGETKRFDRRVLGWIGPLPRRDPEWPGKDS